MRACVVWQQREWKRDKTDQRDIKKEEPARLVNLLAANREGCDGELVKMTQIWGLSD